MKHRSCPTSGKAGSGFTLIEISIVLVIIGLLAGGILVGRDLIHVAEIRATVAQIEKLDTAVNTFREKYNCLPGDCNHASQFGLPTYNGAFPADGDGDGAIRTAGEIGNAPSHLLAANLIPSLSTHIRMNFPDLQLQISPNARLFIAYFTSDTFFTGLNDGHYYWVFDNKLGPPTLTPADAYAIDSKMDDGFPESGKILASGHNSFIGNGNNVMAPVYNPAVDAGPAGNNSNFCVTNDAPNLYNIKNTSTTMGAGVTSSLCQLLIRAPF